MSDMLGEAIRQAAYSQSGYIIVADQKDRLLKLMKEGVELLKNVSLPDAAFVWYTRLQKEIDAIK